MNFFTKNGLPSSRMNIFDDISTSLSSVGDGRDATRAMYEHTICYRSVIATEYIFSKLVVFDNVPLYDRLPTVQSDDGNYGLYVSSLMSIFVEPGTSSVTSLGKSQERTKGFKDIKQQVIQSHSRNSNNDYSEVFETYFARPLNVQANVNVNNGEWRWAKKYVDADDYAAANDMDIDNIVDNMSLLKF